MKSLCAFLRDVFRPVRVYPCQECGRPMTSPEARLLHAVYTECGLADVRDAP